MHKVFNSDQLKAYKHPIVIFKPSLGLPSLLKGKLVSLRRRLSYQKDYTSLDKPQTA